jgi:hypothetical protein
LATAVTVRFTRSTSLKTRQGWNNGSKHGRNHPANPRDEESGWLAAWWDDPDGAGGITSQGQDLRDLQQQILDAVAVHFDEGAAPRRIRLHFVSDPILLQA